MAILPPFHTFQPMGIISFKGVCEKRLLFHRLYPFYYYIIYASRRNVNHFSTAKRKCLYYLFLRRSLISAKRRVFAIAFSSSAAFAAAASSAAFAAAAASAAAFSAFNASTFAS